MSIKKTYCGLDKPTFNLSLVAIFVFLSLICVLAQNQRNMYISSHKEALQILAEDKAYQIDTFLKSEKEKYSLIASMNSFKEVLKYPNDTEKVEIAKNRINELKKIIPGISVMNNDGLVYVGEIDLPGTDYSEHPYFIEKKDGVVFTKYSDPLRKKYYFAVIGPVYDGAKKIIGRIAFDIELDKVRLLLARIPEEGNSAYFIDNTGMILTSSEMLNVGDNSLTLEQMLAGAAKDCIKDLKLYGRNDIVEEHMEEIEEYVNFRGIRVFGAHAYTPTIAGCIISEEGADKILRYSYLDALKDVLNPYIWK